LAWRISSSGWSYCSIGFTHFALTAIIDITATLLALVVAMNKHPGHSRTTARAGVFGRRIFRWEIRHKRIKQEKDRNFGVFYVSRKI